MKLGPLTFLPIDLEKTRDLCLRFREDSFIASFGDTSRFHEADGKGGERYLEWLGQILASDPAAAVHVWEGDTIIGQIELGRSKAEPDLGSVFLFYLAPEKRGQGFSKHLDEYAMKYMRSLGLKKARLSVSPTNTRAVKFYEKQGWKDLGPRPDHPEVNYMMKILT